MYSSVRPPFLRQRSTSSPQLGLVNVSVQEAGIIFSAAERATARRRRPTSELSPGPSFLTQTIEQNSPSPFDLLSTAVDRPSHLANQLSTSSTSSVLTARPLPASIETGLEELAATHGPATSSTSNISPTKSTISSPTCPKRLVPNGILKDYADGLFLFTQSRLNNAVFPSDIPSDMNFNIPHITVDDPPDEIPELEVEEMNQLSRPPLRSRFSDWTTTDSDSVAEMSDLESLRFSSRRDSGVYTPDMDMSGMMSPDSFFSEVTPKVAQQERWTDAYGSCASSPTRGCFSMQQLASVTSSPPRTRSTSVASAAGSVSYFTGFDGFTEAAMDMNSFFADFEVLQSPYTPSTQESRSKRTSNLSMLAVASSGSDSIPPYTSAPIGQQPSHNELDTPTTPVQQMIEVDFHPPSWLVRAIG